jgi:hypothetical protein
VIHATTGKFLLTTPPAAILDNTSAATTIIDTLGYDRALILVGVGASDIAVAALKVTEDDTLTEGALTSASDVTGLVYGTSADISGATSALPTDGDDNKIYAFDIDLKKRKRYLDVVATAGNGSVGTYFSIITILTRAEESPITATQMGLGNLLRA